MRSIPLLHDNVRIVGGPFQDQEGVVFDDVLMNGDHVYLVLLAGDEHWLPERWLESLPRMREEEVAPERLSQQTRSHTLDG